MPSHGILIAILVAAALVSRPLEARLWRAGRLSDRAATALMLGRLPAVVLGYGLIVGASILVIVATTAMALLPMLVAFRFFERFLAQQRVGR